MNTKHHHQTKQLLKYVAQPSKVCSNRLKSNFKAFLEAAAKIMINLNHSWRLHLRNIGQHCADQSLDNTNPSMLTSTTDKINWTALYVSVRAGLMSLMTSHPGAKRLSSIQTGLMVSLSHWLEWKAVKWLCPGVNAVVIGVGTHVLLVLMENLPHRPLWVKMLSKS